MKTKVTLILAALFLLSACSSSEKPSIEPPVIEPPAIKDTIPFKLAGTDYTLPVPYETLIANGWEAVDTVEGVLAPHTVLRDVYMRLGTNLIIVSLHNNTDSELAKDRSLVAGIEAENRVSVNGLDQPVDIQIFDGLDFSSEESAIEAQLPDLVVSENAVYRILTVQHNKLMKTVIEFKHDSGDMRWIKIENFK